MRQRSENTITNLKYGNILINTVSQNYIGTINIKNQYSYLKLFNNLI